MYKIRVRKSLVFDKNEKNLEKKVKKIGTYLTYIGAQKMGWRPFLRAFRLVQGTRYRAHCDLAAL